MNDIKRAQGRRRVPGAIGGTGGPRNMVVYAPRVYDPDGSAIDLDFTRVLLVDAFHLLFGERKTVVPGDLDPRCPVAVVGGRGRE